MAASNVTMTGFKVFGDISTNPTEKIVEHFKKLNDERFRQLEVSLKTKVLNSP